MSEGMIIALITQSLLLIGVVLAAFIKTKTALIALEVKVDRLQLDHASVATELRAISRLVSFLQGQSVSGGTHSAQNPPCEDGE